MPSDQGRRTSLASIPVKSSGSSDEHGCETSRVPGVSLTDREQLYETTYHLAQMVYAAEHPEYPDLLSSALAEAMRFLGQQ